MSTDSFPLETASLDSTDKALLLLLREPLNLRFCADLSFTGLVNEAVEEDDDEGEAAWLRAGK